MMRENTKLLITKQRIYFAVLRMRCRTQKLDGIQTQLTNF